MKQKTLKILYVQALASELALRALAEQRDLTAKDHIKADRDINAAFRTLPVSYADIADLAALGIEVDEPEKVLAIIRDAAVILSA